MIYVILLGLDVLGLGFAVFRLFIMFRNCLVFHTRMRILGNERISYTERAYRIRQMSSYQSMVWTLWRFNWPTEYES